ncbi:MAG TPA: hypothetical protein VLE02_01645 [Nitrosarchaeum sp.]|nr:hypothetical protein [Nitrosarchaeum sp.]
MDSDSIDSLPLHDDANVKKNIAVVGYAILLFAALGNCYVDALVKKTGYFDNNVVLLIVKIAVFALLFLAVYKFLL